MDAESSWACAVDLVNSWCRESGVRECETPHHDLSLRDAIDRLWSKHSGAYSGKQREAYELRERLNAVTEKLKAIESSVAQYGLTSGSTHGFLRDLRDALAAAEGGG